MSPSRSKGDPEADERELDEAAGDLYALRPDAFVAARDERVRQARAEGRASLARAVAGLRRPTQSAWVVNLLSRDQRDAVEQLLELGDGLRRAHQQGSGGDLQDLSAQRRKAEAALLRRARALAADAGVDVTADMAREVEETLGAALARPDVADEIRAGRLTKPVSYSGFGGFLSSVPAPPAQKRGGEAKTPRDRRPSGRTARQEAVSAETRSDQQDRERREEAVHRLDEARELLEAAAAELAEQEHVVEEADRNAAELGARLDDLRDQLRDVEKRLEAAERGARVEARRRDGLRKAHDQAKVELTRAEKRLAD